jgi:organic hydroperoxide reductase OsmC/OhrA
MSEHHAEVNWRRTSADFTYESYNRAHEIIVGSGLKLPASAAPEFRGDPDRLNPEDAFVASLSACHMLTFLAIAARKRLSLDSYEDSAIGWLEKNDSGKLAITRVTLRPRVKWSVGVEVSNEALAVMHRDSHNNCFLANSVKTAVTVEPQS